MRLTTGGGAALYDQDTTVYVTPQEECSGSANNYWYYCTDPAGYFPYVQTCNKAWIPVVPQVGTAARDNRHEHSELASMAARGGMLVAGCATVPTGPNVMVLPGPQKSFEQFQADQMSCQQYAQASIGGASAQQNAANSAVGSAAVGTLLGAAAGAIIGSATGQAGQGAAIGAGTGLLFGSAAGSNAYGYSYYEAQRRYDMAYAQCMYARGNQLPGRVAYRAPPGQDCGAGVSAAELPAAQSFARQRAAADSGAAELRRRPAMHRLATGCRRDRLRQDPRRRSRRRRITRRRAIRHRIRRRHPA